MGGVLRKFVAGAVVKPSAAVGQEAAQKHKKMKSRHAAQTPAEGKHTDRAAVHVASCTFKGPHACFGVPLNHVVEQRLSLLLCENV